MRHDRCRLSVPRRLRRRLREAGERAHPEEACGVLLGRAHGNGEDVTSIVPLPNRSATPRTAYRIDPSELEPLLRTGDVIGFYHSHPAATARFSARDAREAWPAYWYVVVGTGAGPGPRMTAWRDGRHHPFGTPRSC